MLVGGGDGRCTRSGDKTVAVSKLTRVIRPDVRGS